MKALQFVGVGQPLELNDVPEPTPEPGWVVVEVVAAGLCHSDLHILHGPGAAWLDHIPITLGHEVAGTVSALGEGVTGFRIGQRVGVGLVSDLSEGPGGSFMGSAPGVAVDGGYGEKIVAHASSLVPIPEGVSYAAAAVATDSTTTAYHAVRTSGRVRAGMVIGVIGLGGLGLNAVRVADILGAVVYGVDVNAGTFDDARKLGARDCFTGVADLKSLEPEVIIDFAGTGVTTAEAIETVRPRGRVVLVGLGAQTTSFATDQLVTRRVELCGSLGSDSNEELREVYDLIAAGEIEPIIEEIPFADVPEGLARLERGVVRGRLVTCPRG
ncbi:zinc-binding dehydrogenase [Streptomyces sp. H27-D2]|uniref:zinc-binding dehydrogenase n=1 Tax=Streptomyces sp. H27-D2 TaxID=3046304 RepID=UPI002DB8E77C|nr:zinc-binding dehydrogenase [Streptomyces sp. H27-D2]MEC4020620.1 zinc-binding dehydrogenase [Streptomyces sp. H27-D2]